MRHRGSNPLLEETPPTTYGARDGRSFFDVLLGRFNDDPSTVVYIPGPVAAVGLTGSLPPGAAVLLVPSGNRALLENFVGMVAGAPNDTARALYAFGGGVGGGVYGLAQDPLTILRPGEVISFDEPLRDGVVVYPITIGCWKNGDDNEAGGFPIFDSGIADRDDDLPVTSPRAAVRVFRRVGTHPSTLSWTPTAFSMFRAPAAAEPSGLELQQGMGLGGHVTHVTIHFTDDVTTPTRIQGAETGNYEVWWMTYDGLWAHNPADDFDADGRGAATAAHDLEVYNVPRWAVMVCVRYVSGNQFGAVTSAFEFSPQR